MKVETPQILWNSEEEKGINAALMSVSMLQSGIVDSNVGHYGNVMATAGNTQLINLWRVAFKETTSNSSNSSSSSSSSSTATSPATATGTEHTTTETAETPNGNATANKSTMFHRFSSKQQNNTKIDYVCSLTRHDGPVNTVAFSPDGLHLATAGDTGSVIVWSVPVAMRGNNNGRHYWSTVTREQDLTVKIVARSGEGVCDISWSADSKRFIAGTIDHSVFVVEDASHSPNRHCHANTNANTNTNTNTNTTNRQQQQQAGHDATPVDSAWQVVYRNAMDHTHYVQGVAYDPAGVYLASMSSDRTVRVYPRKTPPKSKKKVLRPVSNATASCSSGGTGSGGSGTGTGSSTSTAAPPHQHAAMVQDLLTESKLEMAKSKLVKYRRTVISTSTVVTAEDGVTTGNSSTAAAVTTAGGGGGTDISSPQQQQQQQQPQQVVNKRHLYADESTLESFFRRLSWTTDGAFLITPAALWQPDSAAGDGTPSTTTTSTSTSPYATYMFARHKFDEPYRVLAGLEKPSVAVRPNPVLFTLPAASAEASKENKSPKNDRTRQPGGLPYRSIFAVLTWDSVLVYDTCQSKPLSIARGLHYANLADATWSADGLNLVVCSTDGYLSIISFAPGELGEVYTPPVGVEDYVVAGMQDSSTGSWVGTNTTNVPKHDISTSTSATVTPSSSSSSSSIAPSLKLPLPNPNQALLPPCESGQTATIEPPPAKRAKKVRITPTLVTADAATGSTTTSSSTNMATSSMPSSKRPASYDDDDDDDADHVGKAVDKMSLDSSEAGGTLDETKPKKKKRIQPMLLSSVQQH